MTIARRNYREKEDLLLLDLGFEPAGEDLWRRDGIHFGREAALQRVKRELLNAAGVGTSGALTPKASLVGRRMIRR